MAAASARIQQSKSKSWPEMTDTSAGASNSCALENASRPFSGSQITANVSGKSPDSEGEGSSVLLSGSIVPKCVYRKRRI